MLRVFFQNSNFKKFVKINLFLKYKLYLFLTRRNLILIDSILYNVQVLE